MDKENLELYFKTLRNYHAERSVTPLWEDVGESTRHLVEHLPDLETPTMPLAKLLYSTLLTGENSKEYIESEKPLLTLLELTAKRINRQSVIHRDENLLVKILAADWQIQLSSTTETDQRQVDSSPNLYSKINIPWFFNNQSLNSDSRFVRACLNKEYFAEEESAGYSLIYVDQGIMRHLLAGILMYDNDCGSNQQMPYNLEAQSRNVLALKPEIAMEIAENQLSRYGLYSSIRVNAN